MNTLDLFAPVATAHEMRGWAEFSECGLYRYILGREWDASLPRVLFILTNPSTATAEATDPTLTKCVGYAQRWGFGSLEFVNMFAFRATKFKELKAAFMRGVNVIGETAFGAQCNDRWILNAAKRAGSIVVACGGDGEYLERRDRVVRLLRENGHKTLYRFHPTWGPKRSHLKDTGQCQHPLYLLGDTPIVEVA